LKKQSQFARARIGVNSYLKGDYDNKSAGGAEKNKAKQSQLLTFGRKLWRIEQLSGTSCIEERSLCLMVYIDNITVVRQNNLKTKGTVHGSIGFPNFNR